MSKTPVLEKPLLPFGFDIEISTTDAFDLTVLNGILLLVLKRENGSEITIRRITTSMNGGTSEPFNIQTYSTEQKKRLIDSFLELGISQAKITKMLGLSYSYIGNILRKKKGDSS